MESTVYIVDDDRLARESLRWLIESAQLPVKVFSNGLDFLARYEPGSAGCLLLDVRMPAINGMELHTKLKARGVTMPVIIVTGHADVPMAVRAMKARVYDFIEKPYNDSLMLERVQSAIAYERDNRRNQARINDVRNRLARLTPREQEVLRGVLGSKQNKVIAADLGISIKTVELHRANLMTKMKATSPTQLVRLALIAGLD